MSTGSAASPRRWSSCHTPRAKRMTMMKTAFAAVLALSAFTADAATHVSVIEVGPGGTVRRTTSSNPQTSAQGVASFWAALHQGRKLQHSGMTVVPDMFNQADSGVVIGLSGSGVDLDSMPSVAGLMSEGAGVVGVMEIPGNHCNTLMSNVAGVEAVESSDIVPAATKASKVSGLTGIKTLVDPASAPLVDHQVFSLVKDLETEAKRSGKTIVVHLVVEEEESSARRRSLSRRLEDVEGEGQAEGEEEAADEGDENEFPLYYGYGYYNSDGDWVTLYKTMFQIQYFNIVLWTSIGLSLVLFFTIYLMVNMPLEPDTLLFGESAKMVGED